MRLSYEVKIPWTPQPSSRVMLSVANQFRPPVRGKLEMRNFISRDIALTDIPLFSGPVMVVIWFCLPLGGSVSKSRREILRDFPHDTPPELDDMFKTVKDSLRGLIWARDCQICSQSLQKINVNHHQGSTLIRVRRIEQVKTDAAEWAEMLRECMNFEDAYVTS